MNLVASLLPLSREHKRQNKRVIGWKRNSYRKAKIFLLVFSPWSKMTMALVFPVLLFSSSREQEKGRQNIKIWFIERKLLKSRNSFVCFPTVLSQQTLSTEVIMFLLPCVAQLSDLELDRWRRKNCIIWFWTTFWMKLLFMLSKNLKQLESLDLLDC